MSKYTEVVRNEQYQVEVWNSFEPSRNLDDDVDINRSWETCREIIKISDKKKNRLLRVEEK
jgi:hypothetical protein